MTDSPDDFLGDDDPFFIEEEDSPLELDGSPTGGGKPPPHAEDLTTPALAKDVGRPTSKQRLGLTVALLVLVGLGGAVLFWAAFVVTEQRWDLFERAGTLVLVPLLTLLGTAIGWYYRGETDR